MSTIDPDDVIVYPGNPIGRWLAGAFSVALVLAALLAVWAEPYFVLDRVRSAERRGDEAKLREMVASSLIGENLRLMLAAVKPRPGRRVEQRYDGFARFLVSARRAGAGDDPSGSLTLVLERRGLSWWLVEARGAIPWAVGHLPGEPLAPRPDGLPRFGEYVYVDELPVPVERAAPAYPEAALRAGIQGLVTVQALVDSAGRVRETRVVRSIPALDSAAVESVRRWRFKPATANGRPTAVWVAVPVQFTLH